MEYVSDGGLVMPERLQTSRKIPKGRRNHFTGQYTSGPNDSWTMDIEGHTELCTALVTIARPDVVGLENQVPFEWDKPDGKKGTHYFDFRVLMSDGSRRAIMVKSEYRRQQPEVQRELAEIAAPVTPEFADDVDVMTERDIDPVELFNAEMMHEMRRPDPEADAAARRVMGEIVASVLVRYIVDVYHRTPHSGLDGETPLDCWNRLVEKFGVQPPPDLGRRRLIFGQERERTVTRQGITNLGVRYHSEVLARFMTKAHERKVPIRWYPEDIGAIWAELDGRWYEIPAVFDRYQGVSAQEWLDAAAEIRAQHAKNAEVNLAVVRQALDFIKKTNSDAVTRVGLIMPDWTEKRVEYEEDRLFIGFETSETEAQSPYDGQRSAWGTSLPTSGSAPSGPADENSRSGVEDFSSGGPGSFQFSDHRPGDDAEPADDDGNWTMEDK